MGRWRQPSGSSLAAVLGLILISLLSGTSCRQRVYTAATSDAAADGGPPDALVALALDIAVTGCAAFDLEAVTCTGLAPLSLSFSPIGSADLDSFLWTFGDGSPASTERAPSHTYTLPGRYDVGVTGAGSVGTLSKERLGLVVTEPVPVGAPCDVDEQCDSGLTCFCRPGTGCSATFRRGICSTVCPTGFCGAGAVCVGTSLGVGALATQAEAGASNASPVCLATCQTDTDCSLGFACGTFPASGGGAGWVRGCLPIGTVGAVGSSCRDAEGLLDDALCSTGRCANLGALGVCSADCDGSSSCPPGTACAQFDDGSAICLLACSAQHPCSGDPSLACAPPAGGSGFQIIGAGDPGAAYCAPK